VAIYDVDPHANDEYGPEDLCMTFVSVDEPGDLREWLSNRLDDHQLQLEAEQAAAQEGAAPRSIDGVKIIVYRDADIPSYLGDCDRPHALCIVEHGSDADSQLANWPQARCVDHMALPSDGSEPLFMRGPAYRWKGLVQGLARQWMDIGANR